MLTVHALYIWGQIKFLLLLVLHMYACIHVLYIDVYYTCIHAWFLLNDCFCVYS